MKNGVEAMSKYIDGSIVAEIDTTIQDLLRQTSVMVPPLNFKEIVDFQKLGYDLFSEEDTSFRDFIRSIGTNKSAKSIRGVLVPHEKHMFVKNDNYEKRINYTIGHELAHWSLKWHNELLWCCSEFDLSVQVRKQLEKEANYFSCRLGFLNGMFNKEMADYELKLNNIKFLSDKYNMSVEASLRSAVEHEHRPCALIVMNYREAEGGYEFKKKYSVESDAFSGKMGKFIFKDTFGPNHSITKVMNDPNLRLQQTFAYDIVLPSQKEDKEVPAVIEVWYHTYGVNALIVLK